jgi:predicted RNA-binding Zn-ribbon protein involved in translation (DUF1610 family)
MTDATRKCSGCGQTAKYMYTVNLRIGGTSGGMKLLLGEWAEVGEQMVPMYVFVCPYCGKIELYATEEMRKRAARPASQ